MKKNIFINFINSLCMLAIVVFFAVANTASAAPVSVISTTDTPNQGENATLAAFGDTVLAQSFITDDVGGEVSSLIIQDAYVNPFITDHDVGIYSTVGEGDIGSSLVSFNSSPDNSSGLLEFFPTSSVVLDPNTMYWVVVKSNSAITWKYSNTVNSGTGSISESMYRAKSIDGGDTYVYDTNVDAGGSFGTGAWNFNMQLNLSQEESDTTNPSIISILPENGVENISRSSSIVLTFDEPIFKGSGLITLATGDNNLLVENINVSSSQVQIGGENNTTVVIDPSYDFLPGIVVYVNIPDTAFKDAADNYAQGFNGNHENVPSFTVEYDPYVITPIKAIPEKIYGNTATYTFSISGQGEAQYVAEMCGGDADGIFSDIEGDPESQSLTLFNLKLGVTYECQFAVESQAGYSNFIHIGPFRVVKKTTSGSSSNSITQSIPEKIDSIRGNTCPADQILNQNLKAPSRNGVYNNYTKAIVTEAKILQAHMNRLGFNAGPVDGILGPLSDGAIKRMQKYLGTVQDGKVGPITRGLINNSCDKGSL